MLRGTYFTILKNATEFHMIWKTSIDTWLVCNFLSLQMIGWIELKADSEIFIF